MIFYCCVGGRKHAEEDRTYLLHQLHISSQIKQALWCPDNLAWRSKTKSCHSLGRDTHHSVAARLLPSTLAVRTMWRRTREPRTNVHQIISCSHVRPLAVKIILHCCVFLPQRLGCRACSRSPTRSTRACTRPWRGSSRPKGSSDHWGASTSPWWGPDPPTRSTSPATSASSAPWVTSSAAEATATWPTVRAAASRELQPADSHAVPQQPGLGAESPGCFILKPYPVYSGQYKAIVKNTLSRLDTNEDIHGM